MKIDLVIGCIQGTILALMGGAIITLTIGIIARDAFLLNVGGLLAVAILPLGLMQAFLEKGDEG